jgi:hypothetical protein
MAENTSKNLYSNAKSSNNPFLTGIGEALQGLVAHKTQEITQKKEQQKIAQGLQQLNIPTQEAHHLSKLDPKDLSYVLDSRFKQQEKQNLYKQRVGGLESLFGFTPEEAEQVAPLLDNPELFERVISSNSPQKAKRTLSKKINELATQKNLPEEENELVQEEEMEQNPQMINQLQQQKQEPIEQKAAENIPVGETVERMKPLTADEKKLLSKDERKEYHALEKEANAETKKYYDKVLDVEKASKESDNRLDRMLSLVDKGNLPFSSYYSLLKNLEEKISPTTGAGAGAALGGVLGGVAGSIPTYGVGGAAGAATGAGAGAAIGGAIGGLINPVVGILRSIQRVTSPDTEEFEKLSNQFIAGAKAIFGSRVTDQDLKAFMAQIPTLSNTDAGKKKIIHSLKTANEAEHVRYNEMVKIIKENGGQRPFDLPLQVEERSKPKIDKL